MKKKNIKIEKLYSLCEPLADIAFIAGQRRYSSGNSRQDIYDFISWAKEFDSKWKGKQWGADDTFDDYITEIEKFSLNKIIQSRKSIPKNG